MQIQHQSNTPNFQAKLIIGDKRIQKFIKSSFISKSREAFDVLDKLSSVYPDSIVSVGIKNVNSKDYLVAKNGITGAIEKKFLHDSNIIKLEDHSVFIDLVKKIMKNKAFWTEGSSENSFFDATSIPAKIEHDVFKLEK